jgi:hypothetical protein
VLNQSEDGRAFVDAASTAPAHGRFARPASAWALLLITLAVFMAFGVVLYSPITPHSIFIEPAVGSSSLFVFPFASFAVVGGLIAIRKPQTPIGWLCLFGSLTLGLGALTSLVGTVLTVSNPGIGGWVLLASFLWSGPAAASLSVMVFAFLLFPDGHLPSPRWRWVARALVIVTAISAVLLLINPDQGLGIDSNGESILAIGGARGLVAALNTPVSVAGTVLGLAAVLSLFLRMRGATSERRHQIKWVAAAAALTIGILVLVLLLPLPPSLGWQALAIIAVLYVIAGVAVPTAIAIAVLKYRLYDIDVIINRAVVYGSLAVFITAVYVGIAVGIGTLVGSGGKPNLALSILATAIVAIGFQPVRERVQKIANRLVYRMRCSANFPAGLPRRTPLTLCCRAWRRCFRREPARSRRPCGCVGWPNCAPPRHTRTVPLHSSPSR